MTPPSLALGGGPDYATKGCSNPPLPKMLAHYNLSTSLHRLAAAYAFSISKNHPFVDGNKRTAFLSAYMFLRENGWKLTVKQTDIVVRMLALAAGSLSEEQLAGWLSENSEKSRLIRK